MAKTPETAALIVAAGDGIRAGGGSLPKQFQLIAGIPMIVHTLRRFLDHDAIRAVQVVIRAGQERDYAAAVPSHDKLRSPVFGGKTRQESVRNGLAALSGEAPARVLIHDAARPFVSSGLIDRVTASLNAAAAVVPLLPVASTLKRVAEGRVVETVPRDGLEAAETPQGFAFDAIRTAHDKAAAAGIGFTDDAAVAEWAGIPVSVVAGDPANAKLTTAAEIAAADRRLRAEEALRLGDVRVGLGFDVHALGAGDQVVLGGVVIPHTRGLVGHSDADVVLHAITDAILGALGEGDIGEHFRSGDPRWKDAPSAIFLGDAVARVAARGGLIAHLDVAIVAQSPKISPHRDAMRARIATICGISLDRVGVKATTNEGLGFIGRGEGVSAQAVATVRLPFDR